MLDSIRHLLSFAKSSTHSFEASRGENIELPVISEAIAVAEGPDPLAEHRALLDEARPFHRVTRRPYDPALRRRVADATSFAAKLPPTAHLLPLTLDTTAALAVAVARNAGEQEQLRIIEEDGRRLPACAAVALLQEHARSHGNESAVGAAALERLGRVLDDTDWASESAWQGNDMHGQAMMSAFAGVLSNEHVHDRLARGLEANPGVLRAMIVSCAGWSEQLDPRTWEVLRFDRRYRDMPAWMPIEPVRELFEELHGVGESLDAPEILNILLQESLGESE